MSGRIDRAVPTGPCFIYEADCPVLISLAPLLQLSGSAHR